MNGTLIRERRRALGLTQKQVAEKAGISQSYFAQIETGVKKNLSVAMAWRLAVVLGVEWPELY